MFLIEYIKKYKITYISVVLIFIIGICIGIFITFRIPKKDQNNINQYLQNTIEIVKEKNINKQFLFKNKLLENLKDTRHNMAFGMYYNS